jgi:hypothetical protein
MSQPPVFPSLPGLGWSVKKSPRFQTRTQQAISGRQLRIVDQQYPIWSFTLDFPLLRDDNDSRAGSGVGPGIGYNELRTLAGFFLALQGAYGNFLFSDPTDNTVAGQYLMTGNGSAASAPLLRQMGNFAEPLLGVIADGSQPLQFFFNGVLQSSGLATSSQFGYTGIADTVSFTAAPASSVVVTANYSYYFLCHFADDTMDLANFMYQLWQAKAVQFESVLA